MTTIREVANSAVAQSVFVPRLLFLATLEKASPHAASDPVNKLVVDTLIRGCQATRKETVGVDRKQALLVCDLADAVEVVIETDLEEVPADE